MFKFFKNQSINRLNFFGIIFSALLISIFISIAIYKEYNALQSDLNEIEDEYIKGQKELLILQANKIDNFLKYKEKKREKILFDEIEFIKLDKSEVDIYRAGISIFNQQKIDLINLQNDNFKVDNNEISYIKFNADSNITIKTTLSLDSINNALDKKRETYQNRINNFMLQTLIFSTIILFLAIMLSSSISKLVSKEIGLFMIFFKKASDRYEYINENQFSFTEFQSISKFANEMIRDIKDKDTELKNLNQHLQYLVDQKTKNVRDKNRELQRSKDMLENALSTQDKFIKNSIHEINTPLSIILTNIDLLSLKEEKNRHLSKIEAGAKIIQNIYNDLSYIVKKDRVIYPKELIDFSSFLLSRVEFFNEIAKGNLLKFNTIIEDKISIYFSDIELQRLIDNNLANATKYSFENSTIDILLSKSSENIIFEIINKSNDIKEIQKIFDRFYRENDSRGGFGIGLNIVKNICEKNQVKIDVSSQDREIKFKYIFRIFDEHINN